MTAVEGAFPHICFLSDIRLNNLRSELGPVSSTVFVFN